MNGPAKAFLNRLASNTNTRPERLREWLALYGSQLPQVVSLLPVEAGDEPGLAWHRAMTRYAVEHEMAQRLEDVYRRRTGLMLFSQDNGRAWVQPLAQEMAELLGWSPQRTAEEVRRTEAAIAAMLAFREDTRTPEVSRAPVAAQQQKSAAM